MPKTIVPRVLGGTLFITLIDPPVIALSAIGRDGLINNKGITLGGQKAVGISPWYKSAYQTQLAPIWNISLLTDSGTVNLTGVSSNSLAIYFKSLITGEERQGMGLLQIVQTNPGIISYQVDISDVALGSYDVRIWVTFSDGPQYFDIGRWDILS